MDAEQRRLVKAIDYLTGDSSLHTPQTKVGDAIGAVEVVAKRQGLTPEHLDALVEFVVGQGKASVPNKSRAVRCLIPRSSVPCSAALRLLGGMKRFSLSLQHLVLRWIVLVFDTIDDATPLHAVYSIIMYYIQVDDLRPTVCQLLCYLTRRKDVLEFRVHRLVELQKHILAFKGTEPAMTALLAVYKMYCPHLVSMALPKRRKVWFRPFEKALTANVKRVQELHLRDSQQSASGAAERLLSHIVTAPPPAKRARRTVVSIPTLLSSTVQHEEGNSVSVRQLTSLQELCDSIDRLELPSQMAAVLESGLLKHLFSLWSDPSAALRLTYWLEHTLGYELDEYSPGSQNVQLLHLLKCLAELTEFILEPIPTVESFLSILLEVWDGSDYQQEVLRLLTHLSLQPFDDLREEYLDPLKQLFMKKDLRFKHDCLMCFTGLLRNFAVLEWPRHQRRVDNASMGEESLRRSSIFLPASGEGEDEIEDFEPATTLRLFIKYVNSLIVVALEQVNNHPLLRHAAMCFYEEAAELPETHGISVLSLPHHSVVFRSFLHLDAIFLSRMCTILVSCRKSLSNLSRSQRDLVLTRDLNSMVLDFCDALWRNRAFSIGSRPYPTLLFQMSREFLASCNLHSVHEKLSIIHHPALIAYVHKFFKEAFKNESLGTRLGTPLVVQLTARGKFTSQTCLSPNFHLQFIVLLLILEVHEQTHGKLGNNYSNSTAKTQDNDKQLQPVAIWQEARFKEAYLDFLKQNQLNGLVDFIKTFVRSRT